MPVKLLGLLLLAFSQNSVAAAKIQHWQTSQGSQVFYVQTQGLPMVDIEVIFDAGSARDGKQYGIAQLTSAVLDTGAGDWNADKIAQRFESVGARFSTGVSKDTASLSLRSLTDKKLFNKALDTLQVILTQPKFNEIDFQREKNRTLAGLKHREESPAALARIAYSNSLYKNHPYAHPTSGTIDTVTHFTTKDLNAFYKDYYVASNATVVIVGNINPSQAKQTAEKLMAKLSIGTTPTHLQNVDFSAKAVNKHITFPSSQTHVLSGVIGMHRQDKDYINLYVGNHILGGSGLVSQLFKEVREKKGLAYSAYSYFSPLLRKGTFTMGLQTRNDQTQQAVKIMQNTLKNFVNQGVSEKALIAAKKNITGGFAMRFDTNSKLTNYVAMIGFYKLPLDYLDTFQQRVEAVTVASIKEAFQRRIKPEFLHTITVGGNSGK